MSARNSAILQEKTKRKTLVQQQSETTVRDPAAHAKNQV
jgi:hypothetical protein